MTADAPLVTVIVPGWDVERYAAEALDSLRAQTEARWTAVLVDDGSTDGTGELFAAAAADDDRFRVVRHAARRGLGAARNSGLDLVATRYVGFLDADDVLAPRAMEVLVGSLEASGSEVAVGAYRRLRPVAGGGYAPSAVQPWVSAATAPARRGASLADHPAVTGNVVAWSKTSRIALWRRHGIRFPEGLYEDQIVAQELYVHARGIDTVPEPVVDWRVRAEGTSITQREADPAVLAGAIAAMTAGVGVLRAHGPGAAVQARIGLILDMDVPRLAAADPSGRASAVLVAFADEMRALADAATLAALSPAARSTLEALLA